MGNLFSGALLVVFARWADRFLGLISTMVLARLLLPEDFGIVAMASVVVGLVDVLLDLGVNAVLIHKRDCDRQDFDSAWTVRIIQCTLVAGVLALGAPLATSFYHDDRVAPVLWLMAFSVLISGFENIGIVEFWKKMQFGKEFRYVFLRRLVGFFAGLLLAWEMRSYWALPLGALIGRMGGVALSYALHPFRPRLDLSRLRQIWSYSQWMLLRNTGFYLNGAIDKLFVGRRADAVTMGAYTLADEIAAMPANELFEPIGRVLFPAFVQVRDDPNALRKAYLLAMGAQAVIAIPAAIGLTQVAQEAVALMLGERWMNAVPFVQVLALVYGFNALYHSASLLMLSLGRVHVIAGFVWLQNIVFAVGAVSLLGQAPALALAQWRLSITAASTLGFLALVVWREIPGLRLGEMLGVVWRPLLSAGIMAAVLPLLPLTGWPLLPAFLLHCSLGAAIYTAALLTLWAMAGRPQGAENYLLDKFGTVLRRQAPQHP